MLNFITSELLGITGEWPNFLFYVSWLMDLIAVVEVLAVLGQESQCVIRNLKSVTKLILDLVKKLNVGSPDS